MSDNHSGYQQHAMDGDAAAKTMDKGASAALPNTEFGDGIYEASKPRAEPAGDKATGGGTSMFSASGAIGKHFTSSGAVGGTAQQMGGAFDKEGSIGKQFTTEGSVGGSVQQELGRGEENSVRK